MTEAEDTPYLFRPYTFDDIPFLHSSWGSSYYTGAGYKQFLTPEEFHSFHRPKRERVFNCDKSTVIVCASKENEDLIIGWIAVEKPKSSGGLILHYLYVKQAFKGEGIASGLVQRGLPQRPVMMSHLTERAEKIIKQNKDNDFKDFHYRPQLT